MRQEQLSKLMTFVNGLIGSYSGQDHIAGITFLSTVTLGSDVMIVDNGTTDHMTLHEHILRNVEPLTTPFNIVMPNGDNVTVTEYYILSSRVTLYGVLLVQ